MYISMTGDAFAIAESMELVSAAASHFEDMMKRDVSH